MVVQLPEYHRAQTDPNARSTWAALREAQSAAQRLPNVGLAVTLGLGDTDDVHPIDKAPVGERLARQALARVYGQPVVASGPVFRSMAREGGAIRVRFESVGGGLTAQGGALRGFAVAGADQRFVWADARIEGNTVVVSSPDVTAPVAVRYAWGDNPPATLQNAEGLPAAPFRTDTWPLR